MAKPPACAGHTLLLPPVNEPAGSHGDAGPVTDMLQPPCAVPDLTADLRGASAGGDRDTPRLHQPADRLQDRAWSHQGLKPSQPAADDRNVLREDSQLNLCFTIPPPSQEHAPSGDTPCSPQRAQHEIQGNVLGPVDPAEAPQAAITPSEAVDVSLTLNPARGNRRQLQTAEQAAPGASLQPSCHAALAGNAPFQFDPKPRALAGPCDQAGGSSAKTPQETPALLQKAADPAAVVRSPAAEMISKGQAGSKPVAARGPAAGCFSGWVLGAWTPQPQIGRAHV